VYENDEERIAYSRDEFDMGQIDSNVYRQLRILVTHPRLYHLIACDGTAEHLEPIMDRLIEAMRESHHTHDYPSYTELVCKKVQVEGARRAAGVGARSDNLRHGNQSGGTVDDLALIRDSDRTGGLALFYIATTGEPELPFPSTERLSVLRYSLVGSPKLRALVVRIWEICRRPQYDEDVAARKEGRQSKKLIHRRVLVFFSNPMTQA
jgi:hypothetical protein